MYLHHHGNWNLETERNDKLGLLPPHHWPSPISRQNAKHFGYKHYLRKLNAVVLVQWLYESKVSKTDVWETGTSTSEEGAFQPVSRKVESPWVKTNDRHIFWLATSPLPLTLDYNIILLPSVGAKPEYISFKRYNNVCLVKMHSFSKTIHFFWSPWATQETRRSGPCSCSQKGGAPTSQR